MIVPSALVEGLVAGAGEPARAWAARLPELARRYAERWRLTLDGEPMHGHAALVLPVRGAGGEPAVLKLGWPHPEAEHEALALRTWDGRGAVRLLDADDAECVLLLERLDSSVSLLSTELPVAVAVAGRLLRELAVPAPDGLRSLAAEARRWHDELPAESAALGDPVPRRLLDAAVAACAELGPAADTTMVNEDLHYANVLRGEREPWLVIDPKVLAGDLEFGVCPLLWNRFAESGGAAGRFDLIVSVAGLDAERARGWTLVRAVDNWLWELGRGEVAEAGVHADIAAWAARC